MRVSRGLRYAAMAVAVAVVALAAPLYDRDAGILSLLDVRARLSRAEAHVAALRAERRELRQRIRDLNGDDFAIEAAAREVLGMVRPGELVVRFGDEAEAATGPSAGDD